MTLNVLSLFAGIGGLDLGLERAGMTVVAQVEIDPYCQRVLAKHWPEVPRHDDVRTAVAWWLGRTRPAVDVVAGGFPCQPVSVAGRRRAQRDERWLWPAAWSVIRDLRPRYAIMENVPGLLTRGMGDVLGDLAAIGYDTEWDCIPAATVGAPHRRDRVFIIATDATGAGRETRDGDRLRAEQTPDARPPTRSASASDMADPQIDRRGAGRAGRPASDGPDGANVAASGLADPAGEHGARAESSRDRGGRPVRPSRDGRSGRIFGVRPAGEWATEPDVGRVAHGIPARVDRLRALGNAVVPQVAEHIGRLVMAVG